MHLPLPSAMIATLIVLAATQGGVSDFAAPQVVELTGYSGSAMEPFVSRDGRYLLFNDEDEGPRS